MAKSQETFNKREREKQRIKKQQEKREKMNERKNNQGEKKDLSSMMAYLDENGNLTDTPPDPRQRRVYNVEDIQIGVPKQEDRVDDPIRTGTVSFFNDQKGFGFIIDSETKERIFVHVNDLSGPLKENDKVKFEVESGPKGFNAKNVSINKD
ncbi:MAG: cold-shock protein [Pseudobacter sp.]|uniref:cold-shock protein n=1 Tax=Pseudobacter sp. TaxID=2045420 RepID=UPI003F7EF4F5